MVARAQAKFTARLKDAEALRNSTGIYLHSYQIRGMGLRSTYLQLFWTTSPRNAASQLQYQGIGAYRAAQRVVSLPDFSLPAAADLPGVVDKHTSLLQLYQRCSQRFFRQSVQEVLVAIF